MRVLCGVCDEMMIPHAILARVAEAQHHGVGSYRIVEFRCVAPDCPGRAPVEVDGDGPAEELEPHAGDDAALWDVVNRANGREMRPFSPRYGEPL